MVILASISSSSPPMVRKITRRPAFERAPVGRGQIFVAKFTPSLLGGFTFCWDFDFGFELRFELEDCNTTADDFSASQGRDDRKMAEGRRDAIHFAPEPGPGEV